ncbi:hypothetical protein Tgr7_0606 [Thioalkalivibrio sulfidiphilus HL-EbGr7]|uniref:Uncharacterized protein n=1 Tax=Thioalkalivibrio sulfidiphilus (strain HL-EbGR7) TaxID=396588 RepID=B8GLU9_THISH|nr:hypothetical protein Tgr7_0606 [Thioalkalivibrio sulfidiphilus HL-EbGr7]
MGVGPEQQADFLHPKFLRLLTQEDNHFSPYAV